MTLGALEILKRIKEALYLDNSTILEALRIEGIDIDAETLESYLKHPKHKAHQEIGYTLLGAFLDGFIAYKRGENKQRPDENEEVILDYNLILKKLRVALELKEHELHILFALVDFPIGKQQLKALFRAPSHKNFKPCDTQTFRAFLEGLAEFYYGVTAH